MSNKENSKYNTGTKEKEDERKQFNKPGDKGETSQLKTEHKSQEKKVLHGAKSHQCSEMDEEEECESSGRADK